MRENATVNSRYVAWIQKAKGWGILFIVLGHVAGGGIHLALPSTAVALQGIYKYFYSFHVELFFFLAGITYAVTDKSFGTVLRQKARSLLLPYWFWGLLSYALFLCLAGALRTTLNASSQTGYYQAIFGNLDWWTPLAGMIHGGGWPNGNGFRHNSVLWFLVCLFTCEVGYYAYERYVRIPYKYAWSVALFVLGGCCVQIYEVQGWPFMLPRAIVLGAFFSFGRWYGRARAEGPVERGTVLSGLVLALLLVVVGGALGLGNGFTNHATTFRKYLLFVLTAGVSIAGWCGVSRFGGGRWVEWLGAHSLAIMVIHKFIVMGLQTRMPALRAAYRGSLVSALAASALITVVALGVSGICGMVLARYAPWTVGKRRLRRD